MTYTHIYEEKAKDRPTFVLMHGTGGTEQDLLTVAKVLAPDYNVLALRGDVDENGMNRFFKRKGHGQYDMEDLKERGKNFLAFLADFADENGLDPAQFIPVGFSNGANIILHVLLTEETPFQKAALLSPMYPEDVEVKDLSSVRIFASMGKEDPIMTMEDNRHVEGLLKDADADYHIFWGQGHEITEEILREAREFLNLN